MTLVVCEEGTTFSEAFLPNQLSLVWFVHFWSGSYFFLKTHNYVKCVSISTLKGFFESRCHNCDTSVTSDTGTVQLCSSTSQRLFGMKFKKRVFHNTVCSFKLSTCHLVRKFHMDKHFCLKLQPQQGLWHQDKSLNFFSAYFSFDSLSHAYVHGLLSEAK